MRRAKERGFPGGQTLAEWRALPRERRKDLAQRAQNDLLGSFRFCRNKRCARARTCSGAVAACQERLWRLRTKKPNTLRREYDRLARLADA